MAWVIDPASAQRDLTEERIAQCLEVFREGMPLRDGWDEDGVREAMRATTFAAYLLDGDDMVGYAHYDALEIPDDPLRRIVLWERSICFKPAYQRRGHGRTARRMALTTAAPTQSIGWFGGRTQNPIVLGIYLSVAGQSSPLLPFDRRFDADANDARALAAVAAHLSGPVDPSTGVSWSAYREGRLGNWPAPRCEVVPLEAQLGVWGVERDRGDAIVCLIPFWATGDAVRATPAPYEIAEAAGAMNERARAETIAVYRAAFGAPPYAEVWRDDEVEAALGGDQRLFLARREGRVVGFGAVGPVEGRLPADLLERIVARDERGGSWNDGLMITELGVSPDERRTGVGGALVRRLVATASADTPFALQTHAANEPAIALYRRHGFRLADVAPQPVWARRVDGTWQFDTRVVMIR